MSRRTAHILDNNKWRSDDIRTDEMVEFSSLLLPKNLLIGLEASGFKYPSPIQLEAIPVGKIGKDLIIQAKSGTGKTLVFTVVALNMLLEGATHPQVLIMTPTREIASQISQVIQCVGCFYKEFACDYFIGGRKLEEDVPKIQGCQVIVGTPGRIKQLINYKILKTAGIRLFVLDEADQLLKESSFTTDIDDIFRALPRDKQMIATSATYPDKLKRITNKYFREPLLISKNKKDIGLLGMVHYYCEIPIRDLPVVAYREKLKFLNNVLVRVKFAQCLVFCNMVSRVENLCVEIKKWGFTTTFISSAREQEDRLKAIELLKKFKCKVLVSSDVSSRGIDAENVDLVINFDLPSRLDTYFHRVGRAGRYGSKCANVTFITCNEMQAYQQMQTNGLFESYRLPDCIPENLISLEPERKPCVTNDELSLDKNEFDSDSSHDLEGLNENEVKQKLANDFIENIELNDHNEMSCVPKVDEFASENSKNSSDEKFIDAKIANIKSSDWHELHNHLYDLNSNSVKEDDDLSILELVELESDKADSPAYVKLEQQEVVTEISSSTEIVLVEEENNLKVHKSNGEESCENDDSFMEKKSDSLTSVISVTDNAENFLPKSDEYASNIHGLEPITDSSSCFVDLENNSKKSLIDKTINGKTLIMNNEHKSKLNDPKTEKIISFITTFVEEYENCNESFKECSIADSAKSSQSFNVESNDNEFSSGSLEHCRLNLSRFLYNVYKDSIVNNLKDLINDKALVCKNEKSVNEVSDLKQNNAEKNVQNCNLDSQFVTFAPKTEAFSNVRSDISSGSESSSESNMDKLIEHFNLSLGSIHEIKPANENSTSESSSNSESDSDTSVNSENAMYMLTKEFNKVSQEKVKCYDKEIANKNIGKANIINNAESSSSISDSESGTSIDSENVTDELEQKFTKLIKGKRSDGDSRSMEETKEILLKLRNKNKCFKGIQIVDSKNNVESSKNTSHSDDNVTRSRSTTSDSDDNITRSGSTTSDSDDNITRSRSTTSDSDTSKDSGKAVNEHQKQFNKMIKNDKLVNTRKSSKSSRYKTKTIKGLAENKITYYFSGLESDNDKYSKESCSGLKEGALRKTCKNGRTVSKTNSSYRTKTIKGPVGNKITYYSRANTSEINDIDPYSKESLSSPEIAHQRKRKDHKKNGKLSKSEPSQFDSNATGTSNPYFNPTCEKSRFFSPPSNNQMQPPHYASHPYSRSYSQQRENYPNQQPFLNAHSNYQMQPTYGSNPSYPQQIQGHANDGQFLGSQSSHQRQPNYAPNPLSQSYPCECPLKESCQMIKMQQRSKPVGNECTAGWFIRNSNSQRNSNPSINHIQSNYQRQPSQSTNQCFVLSQHPCHLPNDVCQSPACAAWYDIFYKQWQFLNQSPYF